MLHKAADPTGSIEVVAPFDLAVIAEVETANAGHIDQALEVAYSLYRSKDGWLPLHKRIEILEKTAQIMLQQSEQLALEAAREGGKPCLLYTSPSPRDLSTSRMPSSA